MAILVIRIPVKSLLHIICQKAARLPQGISGNGQVLSIQSGLSSVSDNNGAGSLSAGLLASDSDLSISIKLLTFSRQLLEGIIVFRVDLKWIRVSSYSGVSFKNGLTCLFLFKTPSMLDELASFILTFIIIRAVPTTLSMQIKNHLVIDECVMVFFNKIQLKMISGEESLITYDEQKSKCLIRGKQMEKARTKTTYACIGRRIVPSGRRPHRGGTRTLRESALCTSGLMSMDGQIDVEDIILN
ncbi:hypothetical protein AGLY_013425 [Aphis glycines]|uniref:Uncharacterized protein n=1 Tax=Aphis glycines TaxID=307491 RepID=A0A6G0T6F8_APHGL|nr:hypothetical protein AGLY_013425 [Aphis glycines]